MKNRFIGVIMWLVVVGVGVVCALMPWSAVAGEKGGLDEKLLRAAARGDLPMVNIFLDNGADVNAKPRDGWTPLMSAASGLEWGVGTVFPANYEKMVLVPAERGSRTGRTDVAKLLLQRGSDVNARDKDGRTALMEAARAGHTDLTELLLDKSADVNSKDKDGKTPLMWAAGNVHADVVKLLLENGADVNAKDNKSENALMAVARFDDVALVLLFHEASTIDQEIDPSTEDDYRSFTRFAWTRHAHVVDLLKARGAKVTLIAATMLGDMGEARRLILAGADVNANAVDGITPLMAAAAKGYVELVNVLIDEGADVNAQDELSRTALTRAAQGGHTDTARLLLVHGAYADARDTRGRTPMMRAAQAGNIAMVRLLLDEGAEVNATDDYRTTALIWAAESGSTGVVKLLLDNGADVKGMRGVAALCRAATSKHADVVELLKAYGVEVTLFVAAMLGDEKQVQRFIETGADVNAKLENDLTPLMVAAEMGHTHVVRLLLERGAADNEESSLGGTALQRAKAAGNSEIVELLKAHGANK